MAIQEATAPSNNPVFKFNRETYSVRVDNISDHASRQDIVDLFQNFIGEVRKCDEHFEAGRNRSMDVSFSSRDAFMKALCMTGYNVAGVAISVTPSATPNPHFTGPSKQCDNRRNLYVLGLPFDLTKSEFTDVFSRYGKVAHAVILATIDNASRRRGFVVMSSHAEARVAMNAMSRAEIKGHLVDVSWAVVQRSQGFLDGGDRTVAAPPSSCSSATSEAEEITVERALHYTPARLPKEMDSLAAATSVTCALLITNLPSLLFSNESDLQPLLIPFGRITELKILPSSSLNAASGHVTVAVQYATTESAYEAKIVLQGQVYANHTLQVQFIQSPPPAQSQQAIAVLDCHNQSQTPFVLPNTPFSSNSQHAPRHDVRYPYNAANASVLQRGLATNAFPSAPSFRAPYNYDYRPTPAAAWLSNSYAQTPSFDDRQWSSPLVVAAPALPVSYPSRIA